MELALEIAALVVLLLLAAFFAASEIALTSVNRIRVRRMVDEKERGARTLASLMEDPSRFLGVILLMTLLVQLAANSLAAYLVAKHFPGLSVGVAATVTTLAMVFFIFTYCEVAPKTYSAQNPEKIAIRVAPPVAAVTRILYPLTHVFILLANGVIRLFGGKPFREGSFVTEEEIKTLVTVGEEEGVLEEEEKEMIHSIFEFTDTVVREVMVPRTDMQCLESDVSFDEALQAVISAGHSRIPVYEESIDNIVGILYAKDLLRVCLSRPGKPAVLPRDMLRPAYYIPETKGVSDLLREMQKRKIHIAIVLDEYGGTAGLVTIEDLLEEIVGEIQDEYDLEESLMERVGDNSWMVDARLSIDELNHLIGTELDPAEVDSVGGLVCKLAGKIPGEGEVIGSGPLVFRVEALEGNRISKVLVTREEPEERGDGE